MRLFLATTLAFSALIAADGSLAQAAPPITKLTISAVLRSQISISYRARHHQSGRISSLRAVHSGRYDYALATISGKQELFKRITNAKRWADLGGSHTVVCALPIPVSSALKLAAICTSAPKNPAAPPTTPTPPSTPPTTTPVPPAPDPTSSADIELLAISSAVPDSGSCKVSYSLRNSGQTLIPSETASITVTNPRGVSATASDAASAISIGEQRSSTVSVALDCAAAGSYTVTVYLDAPNQIREANEQNNQVQITINPSSVKLPDLLITAASISADCKTVTATVTNKGSADAPAEAADANFIVRQGTTYVGGGLVDQPAVPAGGSAQISVVYDGPCSGISISVLADAYGRIAESDENNNDATFKQ